MSELDNLTVRPSTTPNIDTLKREAKALVALLENPHPGLISWNEQLGDRLKAISEFYTGPLSEGAYR